jgi:hypothetical protein
MGWISKCQDGLTTWIVRHPRSFPLVHGYSANRSLLALSRGRVSAALQLERVQNNPDPDRPGYNFPTMTLVIGFVSTDRRIGTALV